MKVLFVLTSHSALGNTGKKTGFWIEEFAAPYYTLADNGVDITIASPKGGQPPIDPKSEAPDAQTAATKRYSADTALKEKLAHTKKLADVKAADFDAVFYPGGHGPMWDLYEDKNSIALIQNFWADGKPVAALCHAPSALLNVQDKNGEPLVKGKKVTGFTNTEEEAVQLTNIVPYLLQDELKARGGQYSRGTDWSSYVVEDGMLITGQNPASSEEAAKKLLALLKKTAAK
ncbi:MAG TPA: type 1 glutamine amidotransferase domain-containing protein [Chitinophagaceae bacterium]|nr:type 1 glutamine amidotransferase domain-containing protein [Chitinophagaceae bacterium]